jgi:hypothetical protein
MTSKSNTEGVHILGLATTVDLALAMLTFVELCHRGRGASAAGVDEGVQDLAPARDQIRSVMIGVG